MPLQNVELSPAQVSLLDRLTAIDGMANGRSVATKDLPTDMMFGATELIAFGLIESTTTPDGADWLRLTAHGVQIWQRMWTA